MNRREQLGRGSGDPWLERLRTGEILRPSAAGQRAEFDRLTMSGFPGASPPDDPRAWLRAYVATLAERGAVERRDPERVLRFLRVSAELESQAVPDETVWRAADINRETLHAYDDMLARTHVLTPLPAWDTNRLKRITSSPKRQLLDTAFALALAGLDADALTWDPTLAGRYLESFVVAQLRPEADAVEGHLSHLRTRGGEHEVDVVVDVVIDVGGRLVAIDVKSGVSPTQRDARHLSWLREHLGDRLETALVMHRGEATFQLSPGVWAVPISSLWT